MNYVLNLVPPLIARNKILTVVRQENGFLWRELMRRGWHKCIGGSATLALKVDRLDGAGQVVPCDFDSIACDAVNFKSLLKRTFLLNSC